MQHFYRKIIAREKERSSNSFAKIRRRKIERKYCLLKKIVPFLASGFQKMQRVSSAGVGLRAILHQKMLQKICGSPSTKLFSKIFQIRKKWVQAPMEMPFGPHSKALRNSGQTSRDEMFPANVCAGEAVREELDEVEEADERLPPYIPAFCRQLYW